MDISLNAPLFHLKSSEWHDQDHHDIREPDEGLVSVSYQTLIQISDPHCQLTNTSPISCYQAIWHRFNSNH